MARPRHAPAQPPAMTETVSDIPVGGRAELVEPERMEADSYEWDPNAGREMPPDDTGIGTGAGVEMAPNAERDDKISALLRGDGDAGKAEAPEGKEKPASEEVEGKDEPVAAKDGEAAEAAKDDTEKPVVVVSDKPTRRDILANVKAEREKRTLEASLKAANDRAKAAEDRAAAVDGSLKTKSLLKLAMERGLTREQAVEALVLAEEDEVDAPAAQPAKLDPVVAELKAKIEQMEQRDAQQQAAQANAGARLVVAETLRALDDVPLVMAAKTVTLHLSDGSIRHRPTSDAILEIAAQNWRADGSPADVDRKSYLAPAAAELEEKLRTDYGLTPEAYEAMKTKKAADVATEVDVKEVKPRVPALGKRMTPSSAPKDQSNGLSLDRDERDQQIKARFGLR